MELFYGTGNISKFRNMKALLAGLPVTLAGPAELGITLPEISEDYNTPVENAKEKALAYYRCTRQPSMALDSGLYLEGVQPELQPGVHVRRVGGRTLTDPEFIEYYKGLAHAHGGFVRARFVNGICAVRDENHLKCAQGAFVSTDWFWLVDQPNPLRTEGFPMDSLAVYPESVSTSGNDPDGDLYHRILRGRYWIEGDSFTAKGAKGAKGSGLARGVRAFFEEFLAGDDSWRLEDAWN